MSNQPIEKAKSAVNAAGHIPADKKAELSALLSKLNRGIARLSETHREDADSIAQLVEASTYEATRTRKEPERIEKVLGKLKQTVENFEASHPELVEFVIRYSGLLSEMGL